MLETVFPDKAFLGVSDLISSGLFRSIAEIKSAAAHSALPLLKTSYRGLAVERGALLQWIQNSLYVAPKAAKKPEKTANAPEQAPDEVEAIPEVGKEKAEEAPRYTSSWSTRP
jgi:hypothetical protein